MAAETEIERLIVRLVGDASSYQKMMKDAEEQAKKTARLIENRLKVLGQRMSAIGRSMALRVTAPLTLIGGVAVKAFSDFDKAMVESTSIMKVTETQIESLRQTALELSTSGAILQAPKELAESYFFLASAGKNAEQSMALLPKVAAFATAGAFDMALATDLLTDAQSALGLSSKNVVEDTRNLTRVSDVLVKANTLANASVQQFSTALTSKAGAALKSYKKDVEEGVAVLAALADQGVKAELAGNALDRVIRLAAKGAIDNAKAHERLGFKVFDASGKMRNLGDIIANLEDVLDGMSDKQRAAALGMLGFEARVQGVILPLLGTSDAIKKYERELRRAKGTTQEVADRQMRSFSAQMKVLKNQITAAAVELGQILAPIVRKVGQLIAGLSVTFANLGEGMQTVIAVLGTILAAGGPVLIMLGFMAGAVSNLIVLYKTLAATVWAARAAMAGLITLGAVAFFTAFNIAVADANKELGNTNSQLDKMVASRRAMLESIDDEMEREKALGAERKRLFREVEAARQALREHDVTPEGELFRNPLLSLGDLIGVSGRGALEEQLRFAENRLEQFNNSQEAKAKESAQKKLEASLETQRAPGGQPELQRLVAEGLFKGLTFIVQAQEKFNEGLEKATGDFKDHLRLMRARLKLLEESKRIIEDIKTPLERFHEELANIRNVFGAGFLTEDQMRRAAEAARDTFERTLKKGEVVKVVKVAFKRVTATEFGGAEAQSRLEEFRALAGSTPQEDKNTERITSRLDRLIELQEDRAEAFPQIEAAGLA